MRGRRASRALRRRPEAMFFAPFSQRVPQSSQPDHLLSARTPSPAAHPMHERRPHLHLSLQPRRGSSPGTVGCLRPTVRGDAGHRGAMDMRQEPSARAPFTASGHETDARRLRRSPGLGPCASWMNSWNVSMRRIVCWEWSAGGRPSGRAGCTGLEWWCAAIGKVAFSSIGVPSSCPVSQGTTNSVSGVLRESASLMSRRLPARSVRSWGCGRQCAFGSSSSTGVGSALTGLGCAMPCFRRSAPPTREKWPGTGG